MDIRDKAVSLIGYLLFMAMAVAVIAADDAIVPWLLILIAAQTSR